MRLSVSVRIMSAVTTSVMRSSRAAILTEERHEPQAEHVERRQESGHDADQPESPMSVRTAECLPQNFVLGEEAGQWWESSDRKGRDRHYPERYRDLLSQAAHVAHVLLTAQSMDDRAGAEEEQCLEERMRHQVEDAGRVSRYAGAEEHVAKL